MSTHLADAQHHLEQGARYKPGTDEERYHTSSASILASLHAAATQLAHVDATNRVADVQERLYTLLTAEHAPATPEAAAE